MSKIIKKKSVNKFKQQVQKALALIRPSLKMHSGNVKLVSIDQKQGLVKVKLQGMCVGCAMAEVTLQEGIAEFLKKEIKGVKKVEGV